MLYIAHRGKTIKSLENTIEAFTAAALDPHYDGIECDIYSTKDGEFIVHHDSTLKRLAAIDQPIMDLTYQELRNVKLFDQHKKSYQIPHLVEFLDLCKKYRKRPIIEIKKIHDITLLNSLVVLLEDYKDLDVALISFDLNYLKYARALSSLELYLLTTEITDQLIYDCQANGLHFNMSKELVSKELIQRLQKRSFKIGVFTVNDRETEEICKLLKLDFLTTDSL